MVPRALSACGLALAETSFHLCQPPWVAPFYSSTAMSPFSWDLVGGAVFKLELLEGNPQQHLCPVV